MKNIYYRLLLTFTLYPCMAFASNQADIANILYDQINPVQTFAQAKKIATRIENHLNKMAGTPTKTFYCGCNYIPQGSGGKVNMADCFQNKDQPNSPQIQSATARLHWEHIVPASKIGNRLSCWTSGHAACTRLDKQTGKMRPYKGRACCKKVDLYFQRASSDLHNLVPSSGWINMKRRDYAPAIIKGEARQFGRCDFEINKDKKQAEATPALRGKIARSYLYMEQQWGVALSLDEKIRFTHWHHRYPPDQHEINRAELITKAQGRRNPFIMPEQNHHVRLTAYP